MLLRAEAAEARVKEIEEAHFPVYHKIEQVTAKALGFGFEQDGMTYCVGDHTPESIVGMLAARVKALEEALESIVNQAIPPVDVPKGVLQGCAYFMRAKACAGLREAIDAVKKEAKP